jgi:hypothetical protein
MKGDTAAASAIFQKRLDGELPEELTLLSRRHVQENQNQSVGDGKRRGGMDRKGRWMIFPSTFARRLLG